MLEKGVLISIEGIDGAGKGTNIQLLEHSLNKIGIPVVTYSFPQYESVIGDVIAKYLKGDFGNIEDVPLELVCIAYAADRARFSEEIASYLENGYVVICDRYSYSNVFNMVKMNKDKWDDFINWIEDLEFNCLGVVKPDYNIYLHVDAKISTKRINERGKREYQDGKDDIHESNYQLLKNATEGYLYIAESKENWFIVDEMNNDKQIPVEEVFSKLFKIVNNILNKN